MASRCLPLSTVPHDIQPLSTSAFGTLCAPLESPTPTATSSTATPPQTASLAPAESVSDP
ncbi:hypothetical protein PISMIDRAFT_19523 [Pisolithus microcarpus 441]|uniref:Uncharacterized protein n=1 Tax=Pisolithus microcarpus 441 TaxID=765257 RepID=A0A0C9XGM2_9AGAM|nr:hypothetical protein PISMIDRAFT_19523 [Pisolithus microcarpus 441]